MHKISFGLNSSIAVVAQWTRESSLQIEGSVFESKPRQIQVIQTGSDSFSAKRSAIGVHVSVTGPQR